MAAVSGSDGPTLARLILDRKMGRSFEKLSEDCGGEPAGRRLQQMTNTGRPMRNFPDPDTIAALARGLGASEKEVLHACARSLGLRVGHDERALTIAGAGDLPEDAVRSIMDVARALMSAHGIR
ncbi:MAG TPA: hypothetical protein VF867_19945 [Arthrobacter sp.]